MFERADIDECGSVTIYELGKYLIEAFGSEQNYIKDIFQLLDMDKKGYITQADITSFVHQIVDPTYENQNTVKEMFIK